MNYHYVRAGFLNHIWSLSVQEQFHLLWPITLVIAAPRKALVVASAASAGAFHAGGDVVLGGRQSCGDDERVPGSGRHAGSGLPAGRSAQLAGNAAAYCESAGRPNFVELPTAMVAASPASFRISPALFYVAGQTAATLAIVLWIEFFVRFPGGFWGWMLNSRPFVFIGTLSYSLYLWQELFFEPESPGLMSKLRWNLVWIAGTALFSYYVVERPALRLKAALEARLRRRR
jgi:peptidoglycan/LPS O-acetylase OafA/YrhL